MPLLPPPQSKQLFVIVVLYCISLLIISLLYCDCMFVAHSVTKLIIMIVSHSRCRRLRCFLWLWSSSPSLPLAVVVLPVLTLTFSLSLSPRTPLPSHMVLCHYHLYLLAYQPLVTRCKKLAKSVNVIVEQNHTKTIIEEA